MYKPLFFALPAAFVLLLSGCTGAAPSISSSSAPSVTVSPTLELLSAGTAIGSLALQPTQFFVHDDDFYNSLARSIDIVMPPLFENVKELTPKEQALYFAYFVDREGLYQSGEEWYDPKDKVYRIPVSDIAEVLHTYLGVKNFDPLKAYGNAMHQVDYAKVPLGYDPDTRLYVTNTLNGWGGMRISRLMKKELLGKNMVRITVGFFDHKSDVLPFKKKVVTLREVPGDRTEYTLLSVVDIQNVDGQEIVVSGFHGDKKISQ